MPRRTLVAASNKTVQGILDHVLPAKSEQALNKFLTEYDWDEEQRNRERLELLQTADDTKWSSDGVVIIDDTCTHKTGEQIPKAGKFYDHTVLATSGDRTSYMHCTPTRKSPIHSHSDSTKKTHSDALS